MTREVVSIEITESGSRVVKRNLDDLSKTTNKTNTSVDFLRKSLQLLGAGFVAKQVFDYANSFVALENRLRAVGLEGKRLDSTYSALLKVANNTRSGIEGTVESFSRLTNASKEAGKSQEQLIQFTETLNKAIVLSGASAQEAESGMRQLSQGLASGALRGDELVSVLENLPIVADVIADGMDVTRGKLRELGADGKVTGEVVFAAFEKARASIGDRFSKTVLTVDQAFTVLRNNLITSIGRINKEFGFTTSLSKVITALANNVDVLADSIVSLTKVLLIAGSAYAAFLAAGKANDIMDSVSAFLELRKAVSAGTFVLLGSAEAERQRAKSSYQAAVADAAASGAALNLARSEEMVAAAKLHNIQATASQLASERMLEVSRLQAQISDKGRMMSLTRLAAIRKDEAAILALITRQEAALTAARTAGSAADSARAASMANLQRAQAGLAATTAAAAGSTTLLGQAGAYIKGIFVSLFAVIAANPFTALAVVLTAAVTALFLFRDQINLGIDEVTTFGDLLRAVGEIISKTFSKITTAVGATFKPLFEYIGRFIPEVDFSIGGMLKVVAFGLDKFVGAFRGAIGAVIELFRGLLPAVGDLFIRMINFLLDKISEFVSKVAKTLKPVLDLLGQDITTDIKFQIENDYEGKAKDLGANVNQAMADGFNSSNFFTKSLDSVFTRAQEIARARIASGPEGKAPEVNKVTPETDPDKKQEDFSKILNDLRARNKILKMGYEDRKAGLEILDIERQLEIQLTAAQRETLLELQKTNQQLQLRADILDSVREPQENFKNSLTQINELLRSNQISLLEGNKLITDQVTTAYESALQSTNNFVGAYHSTMQQINDLRSRDLISEEAYQKAKSELEKAYSKTKLEHANNFFGNLATLQNSQSKKAFAIGKAAAITQAVINTYQSAVASYASLASIPYVGPALGAAAAAAAIAAGMVNVQQIRSQQFTGYMEGGYTGDIAKNEIAGVVHGQEYVMNADATRRIGIGNLQNMEKGYMPNAANDSDSGNSNTNSGNSNGQSAPNIEVVVNAIIVDSVEKAYEQMKSQKGKTIVLEIIEESSSRVAKIIGVK